MVRAAFEGGGALFSFLFSGSAGVDSMTGDARGEQDNNGRRSGEPPTDEAALSARLKRLDKRLSTIQGSRTDQTDRTGGGDRAAQASAMARGLRLSSELVAGVLLGAAIGWALDRFLSTSPWGLIVFLLLGFAAGVLNVMRSAGVAPGGVPDSTRKD
jgi:ATP synthase protein I